MPSGFGFELTMRLKREPGETGPPTWPAELLQALARYVFQSGMSDLLTMSFGFMDDRQTDPEQILSGDVGNVTFAGTSLMSI